MNKTKRNELIRVDSLLAVVEVDVELDGSWGPTFSVEDARKLESVRTFLEQRNLSEASRLAKVYELTPVKVA